MKKFRLLLVIAALYLAVFQSVYSKIKLPAVVSSNMVLQRNTTVKIWGWADANEKIKIKTSWLKKDIEIKADANGNWTTDLQTTNSKEAQTIVLTSSVSNITLDNILFGEVWLCSGQSNMEMTLNGYQGQPILGASDAILKSKNNNLRLFSVTRTRGSKTPLQDAEKFSPWQSANPETVAKFSAVGYFFGSQLQEILDVPVGLILTSWGGSSVQAWMSNEALSAFQKIDLTNKDISQKPNAIPTVLFNSMVHPLIPYTIKGALWYQGESNVEEFERYKTLFPAMIKDWRTRFGIGDFPFYYTQIAPYIYSGNDATSNKKNSAFIREVQLQCLDAIPNSGLAITMDIGSENSIHPPNKKVVADRLLFNVLNKTYDFKTIHFQGPVYDSMEEKDCGLLLKFKEEDKGVFAHNELEGFEIAGADKVFYPAKATILNRKNVYVKSEKVLFPVAVRYCWSNWASGTLYNNFLLPASSFRTDSWTDATRIK